MFFRKLRNSSKILVMIVVVAFALGGTLFGLTSFFGEDQPQAPWGDQFGDLGEFDATLMAVNGEEIPYREFYNILYDYYSYLAQLTAFEAMDFQNDIIEFIIERVVLLQQAEQRGIKVEISDAEVQEIIDDYLENTGMTMAQFEQQIRQAGDSLAAVKERVRHALWESELIFAIEDDVKAEVEVTEEEIIKEYEQARVSNIFVKFEEHGHQGALERIGAAYVAFIEGADFAELAAEYSDSPLGQEKGGDLGFIRRGDRHVHPLIVDFAFSTPKGDISEIFITDEGYHIIKVVDRIEAEGELYQSAKLEIENKLRAQRAEPYYREWLQAAINAATVKIDNPLLGGFYRYKKGQFEQAVEKLEEAIDNNPDNAVIYSALAVAYKGLNNEDKAIEISEKALEQFPDNWEINFAFAELLRSMNRYEAAGEQLNIVLDQADYDYYTMLTTLRMLQGMGLEDLVVKAEKIVHQLEIDLGYRQPVQDVWQEEFIDEDQPVIELEPVED